MTLCKTIMLCCLVTLISPASTWAAGNVLLPNDTNASSSDSVPNLGLSPPTPPAPPQQTPAPAVTAPIVSSPDTQTKAAPPAFKESDFISPIDKASAAKLPRGVMPTQIIHQPDSSQILAQAYGNLPFALTISLGGQSIFGAKDVDAITTKLGIPRNQIATNCLLTVKGIVVTDKNSFLLDSGTAPQVGLHYDGVIRKYTMSAVAVCLAQPLPPGSGFVTETNGRYLVNLQPINCPPPDRSVQQLIITYNGTDKSQCVYQ